MDMMFEAYLTNEVQLEPDDIPNTKEPVWILGKKYSAIDDLELIRQDIRSRLWFTYRRGFVPIGDSGLTSDKGWGCMLRCGQMVLAQALLNLHLGRDWVWNSDTKSQPYLRILRLFEDRRCAVYSIHQVALMGATEGKEVGQWFGPNTVAQVLKKLAFYDEWSSVAFHVALDNTIVINEIKQLCRGTEPGSRWKPLVLVIPLRLGLSDINPIYMKGLKTCFSFRQSLGVIGGKPNHALYFIGCVGDEVIYLDPHTTQQTCFVEGKDNECERQADQTYHCQHASRLPILNMDPSLAVCFFCPTEHELDSLCQLFRERIVEQEKQPLFEVCEDKPDRWSPVSKQDDLLGAWAQEASENMDSTLDESDEDFELLG
ncbi:cysteine protease ATG4B [Thrips palmi]|uniref:Cysteine protease n=1 Tax=Thrips palmi TaxID=161013 RepID=A0A6P8YDL9_THRPL|nr:cysteine protease ATG4B [Thrips palmi]XP_034237785.1 cysteine protease ATG4B [Thrips palmi]XP_034237786.1 cysteine protease ATG4B [Thrips palmi]XP_034237787.1 cysteine protease ATG4B [Thrips palmi]XP_034237788.1 cysteine protease ATG4B [Thrips palmi]XP_034237789.1 cysteine protease ATG4B [Thrips palmi]